MTWFPITDPSREDDIRMRRRRALWLLSTLVFVPWIMVGDHGARHDRSAMSTARTRWVPDRVVPTTTAPDRNATVAESRTFAAKTLRVDLPCASSVTVLPDPALVGRAILSVARDGSGALSGISIGDGSVTQPRGCSDDSPVTLRTSNVMPLTLVQSGENTLRAGSFDGDVTITSTGSGDVVMEHAGMLTVTGQASGNVTIGSVTGPLTATMHGSGDLKVEGGTIPMIDVSSHASADLLLDRVHVLGGRVALDGSGDLRLGAATGTLQIETSGSGDVIMGEAALDRLTLRGTGAGDITIRGGHIDTLDAIRDGAGDLVIQARVEHGSVAHYGEGDVSIPRAGTLTRTGD